jgi:hypothetical protein
MVRTAHVYVPIDSAENLGIGIRDGIWGWHAATLDRGTGRRDAESLQRGDVLVLAHKGPNPRVGPGGWRDSILETVYFMQVRRTLYQADSTVWPDDVYPDRMDLQFIREEVDVGAKVLSEAGMEALRLSANKQGAPVLVDGVPSLENLIATDDSPPPDSDGDPTAETEVNGLVLAAVRKEQAKLRKRKFGGELEISCELCGRVLPVRTVRAAHIKRRSHLHFPDHFNIANIMAACTLGCDELFEHGYIYVDHHGAIRATSRCARYPAIVDFFERELSGKACTAHRAESERFFAYHRREIALIADPTE